MKNKYFLLCGAFFISILFSAFALASSLEFECKLDPEAKKPHVFSNTTVTVIINDALKIGTTSDLQYYGRHETSTKLWCNGSQSALECYGVVNEYGYPDYPKQELIFKQENGSYKLTSLLYHSRYHSTYPNAIVDVFFCEKLN